MHRIAIFFFLFVFIAESRGQVYHTCPLHDHSTNEYKNVLFDKWLSAYDVKFYDLRLSVSNESTEIEGLASILIEPKREMDTLVLELQDALHISNVSLADNPTNPLFVNLSHYHRTDHVVYISLEKKRSPGEQFIIEIDYEGEAGQDRGFFAGITSATDPSYGFKVTYTLSEPHNAKDWFPVKQVLEDKIDSAWISLECDDHLMAASNGLLEDVTPGEKNRHTFKWRTRYPMAYYLLSFAVAEYRDFSFNAALSEDGDSVLVQNFIYNSDLLLSDKEEEILATGSMISAFSKLLIDYPFAKEKYGHAMAPMGGGMEHQTMTTIHNFSFNLVAHELAHQWFGDYITCGNWQDIWINEGFASYMEYVAGQQLKGQEFARGWMTNAMSLALAETEGSVHVPEELVNNSYRLFDYGLTYKKGAILLHMIRYHLDEDELFFNVLRTYLEQYGNGLATGEDFREILESLSGMDFSCFFNQWYYGEGYPRFNLQWFQEGDSLKIHSKQVSTTPEKTPFFNTPFDVEFKLSDGTTRRHRFFQDEPVMDFTIAAEGVVTDLLFDPDTWLLKSSNVIHQVPANRNFVYGPNPVTDELFIQFKNASYIDQVLITNMSGQEVLKQLDAENPVTIHSNFLPNFLAF